jgi:D-alanyl-D-alanine carboxypeptidase
MRLLFVLLLFATPALSDAELPDTPAGHAAHDWIVAFNSGERAQIEAMNEKYHRKKPPEPLLNLQKMTGGIQFLRADSSVPGALAAYFSARDSDLFLKITFTVDPTNVTDYFDVEIGGAARPADLLIPRLPQSEAIKALDTKTEALAVADKLSGAMLVERAGKLIYRKSWGLANRETYAPVTLNTKFRLGSMNKMFTAVSVLQLINQGKLALDDTVGKVMPDYPNVDIASKVTIRMLLSHSGGTGDIFGPEFDKYRLTLKTNEDYVKLYGARAPLFEPGSQERYSNYGFVVLGVIVSRISGEDYYDYVQTHVFAPAGMKDSGSLPEDIAVPDRAAGYMLKDNKWVPNTDTLPYRGMAAGGGYSTVGDLVKFARALESGKLLPKALLADATDFHTKAKWYGYGFSVDGEGPARYYGHNGGAPGMNGELRVYSRAHTVVVALSNLDPPAASLPVEFYGNRMPLN